MRLVDNGAQYLRQKAERYRTLAHAVLDQYTTQALLKLATEYEARAAEAEIRDSHDLERARQLAFHPEDPVGEGRDGRRGLVRGSAS